MITLNNGATVLAFKGRQDYSGTGWHGTVVAKSHNEYVTWRVSRFDGQDTWDAYSGHYLSPGDLSEEAYLLALEDFYRR